MKTMFSLKNIMRLFIAGALLLAAFGSASGVSAQSTCGSTYTVKAGDYLTAIAKTCGVTYTALLAANPSITNPSRIYPGQVLNIPQSSIPVTGSQPTSYTVKSGDTLYSIGQKNGLSVTELRTANPGVGSTITVGQVLNIPARVRFAANATAASLKTRLEANSKHAYLLNAAAGQVLEVELSAASGVTLAIVGADGAAVKSASSTLSFRGALPKSQDYLLLLASGSTAGDYTLSVDVPARIRFAAGGTSAALSGTVPAGLGQYFILRAGKDQTLNVTATPSDRLQLTVYGVDGTVLKSSSSSGATFSGTLPSTQDYILVLRAGGQSQSYNLTVSIPASSVPVTGSGTYTVQRGDTLLSIARKFNTTVNALLRANPEITDRNVIEVGKVLYLPGASFKLSNGQLVYVVAAGDTMGSIARKFNTTLNALVKANAQITNPDVILVGQRVNIP